MTVWEFLRTFLRGVLVTLGCLILLAGALFALVMIVYGASTGSASHLAAGVLIACAVGGCLAVAVRW